MFTNTLHYNGLIDEGFIAQVTEMLNGALQLHLGQRKDLRKICSFALELLDNGLRYGGEQNISFRWTIHTHSVLFELTNHAAGDDALRLQSSVRAVMSMSSVELEEEFKKQMLNPGFGKRGGAGLGWLQIVRKGARVLDVQVDETDFGDYVCHSAVEAPIQYA